MSALPDRTSIPPWWDSGAKPTNGELAHWLSITSDANRDWWLDRIQQNSDAAARCFEQGHDSLGERLDAAYRQLREAHGRIGWLERNYCPQRPSTATGTTDARDTPTGAHAGAGGDYGASEPHPVTTVTRHETTGTQKGDG